LTDELTVLDEQVEPNTGLVHQALVRTTRKHLQPVSQLQAKHLTTKVLNYEADNLLICVMLLLTVLFLSLLLMLLMLF
jgi:hypothetical protein